MRTLSLRLLGVGLVVAFGIPPVRAEETPVERAQSVVEDAGKEAKQAAREARRDLRHQTGQGSVGEDVKDAAKDVRDEATTGARKLKRKVD